MTEEVTVDTPRIPGFHFERLLGAGAYGQVYLAREQEGLKRPVALKLFTKGDSAFARELSILEKIEELRRRGRHPGIVQALGSGEHEGRGWIALEFLERGSLKDRVEREGPLPWAEALDAVEEAAAGLKVLHEAGLFHRDVKPANLLMGSDGKVRLADFGLSRELDGTLSAAGSPAFAAPEVIAGTIPKEHAARVDVYGLGATLAYLLTASPARPGRPDAFSLERAGTPRPVCGLVLDAMAYEPEDRPADAGEFEAKIKGVKEKLRTSSGGLEEAFKEDEPMIQTQTKTKTKTQLQSALPAIDPNLDLAVRADRCPFCHEEVAPSEEDKQACLSCMAWHHASCLEEHGACATCGAEVKADQEQSALEGAYGKLFGVLSTIFIVLGVAAGGLVGWWAQEPSIAGALCLVGAVVGLVLSHAISVRFVGKERHGELAKSPREAAPEPRLWRIVKRLPNSFLFGIGWGNSGVLLGLLLGARISQSAAGILSGIFLGGLCGAAIHLAFATARVRAEDAAAEATDSESSS
jgi:protein kinase-like protein